ncbi:hypothetical protein BSQ40_03190 [Serratia fonticola]|nr:hypothetical protein BSQ40_03190 [Serratia fonticola]
MLCLRDTVGTNASFHCKDGSGYSTDIDKAHAYTREEAQSAWNCGRDIDLPISAYWVNALSVFHVDHQHVPGETTIEDDCDRYVGFVKGQWDGNDLYWLCNGYIPVTDFSNASIYCKSDTERHGVVWIPFHIADAVKRRTFAIQLLNRRTMIQGAGLRKPDWLKRQERRNPSGKVRWNCPCCGKISWQFNPYDFDGCKDVYCEEYRREAHHEE